METFQIKLAKEEDLEAMHLLIVDRCKWFIEQQISQWKLEYYPIHYNVEYFREQMKENELYVVKDKNKIIGMVLLKNEDPTYWQDEKKAFYIHHLTTHIDYHGIGKMLIQFAIERAKKCGKEYLRLDCFRSNVKLNKYYESLGFELCGSGGDERYYYHLRQRKV